MATTLPTLHNSHLFLSLNALYYPVFQCGTVWASLKAMAIYATALSVNLTILYKGLDSDTGLQMHGMLQELEFLAYPEHVSATSVSALLVATSKENLQTIIWSFTFLHKTSTSEIILATVLFQHYQNSSLDRA